MQCCGSSFATSRASSISSPCSSPQLQRAQVRLERRSAASLMVWAAMGVFGAVTSAVNHAWGVEKQPSYFKHKLISFVMLVVAGALMMLGLLTVSAINVAEARWFEGVIAGMPRLLVLQGFAVRWATTILFIIVVGLVFYFVPERQGTVPRRVGRRRPDRVVLAGRPGPLLGLRARSDPIQQRARLHRRSRRVSVLGLRVGSHPALRCRGDRGVRASQAPPGGFVAGRAVASRMTSSAIGF